MAFMVPVMRKDYNLYAGKSSRSRTTSACSEGKSNGDLRRERTGTTLMAVNGRDTRAAVLPAHMTRQMSLPSTMGVKISSTRQITIPSQANNRRRTVSERPMTASERVMLERRKLTSECCSTCSEDSHESTDSPGSSPPGFFSNSLSKLRKSFSKRTRTTSSDERSS